MSKTGKRLLRPGKPALFSTRATTSEWSAF